MTILVVDDFEDNQIILEYFLSRAGAQVHFAENGFSGMEKALSYNYQMVLMDIQMPIMDGYESVAQLRQQGYLKPVIALTAHALKGEREKCLAAGFTEYLTKPIQPENLISKICFFQKAHLL